MGQYVTVVAIEMEPKWSRGSCTMITEIVIAQAVRFILIHGRVVVPKGLV